MADPVIINTPGSGDNSGGSGFLVGVILLILFLVLFFWYGLPYIRSFVGSGTPQINIPNKVDVNINKK